MSKQGGRVELEYDAEGEDKGDQAMTLFIASLIIYQFDMSPWLYLVAAVLWLVRTVVLAQALGDIGRG